MTKFKLIVFATLVVLCFSKVQGQNDTLVEPKKPVKYSDLMDSNFRDSLSVKYIKSITEKDFSFSGNWIIGAGINMVEDSGDQTISDFFTLKHKNWGAPFYISAEYLTSSRFSLSATFLFNKYQSGKQVQFNMIQDGDEPNYMAIDLAAKLFLRKILNKHKFTPYVTAGLGYTSIESFQASNQVDVANMEGVTVNAGLGAYYWFNRSWGLNFNYISKLGKTDSEKNGHLVSSFGVFYRFDTAPK